MCINTPRARVPDRANVFMQLLKLTCASMIIPKYLYDSTIFSEFCFPNDNKYLETKVALIM